MPNTICGILLVALVILFFLDKKIAPRFKRAAAVVLGIYLICFYIPAFTILMHGGTHTNWFPIRYSFTAQQDGPIYHFDTSIPGSPNGIATPAIKYVGFYHKGDAVEGKIPLINGIGTGDFMRGYCANLAFAYADNAQLAQYAAQLNSRDIEFNVVHENDLTGSFTAAEGQRVLFTIPWDEGWTCYIDGKLAPIYKTWNLFMSVEVPAGQHSYEMKFFPAWMNYGLIVSGAAFVGLIILMVVWKQRKKDEDLRKEKINAVDDNREETMAEENVTDAVWTKSEE